jgi:hypothetical protein
MLVKLSCLNRWISYITMATIESEAVNEVPHAVNPTPGSIRNSLE